MLPGVRRKRSTISSRSAWPARRPPSSHRRRRSLASPLWRTSERAPSRAGPARPPWRPATTPSVTGCFASLSPNGGKAGIRQVSPGAGVATVTAMAPPSAASGPSSRQPSSSTEPSCTSTSRPSWRAMDPSRVRRPLDSGPRTTSVETVPEASRPPMRGRLARSSGGATTSSSGGNEPAGLNVRDGGRDEAVMVPRSSRSQMATGRRATHSERGSAGLSTTSSPARASRWHRSSTSPEVVRSARSQPSSPKHGRREASGTWRAAKREPKRMSASMRPAAMSTSASRRSSRASGKRSAVRASSWSISWSQSR